LTHWFNQFREVQPLFDMPKTLNLTDQLFFELRSQILSGALPAGGRLPPERELAASFETNRNTLREAIRKLEQQRLVRVRHGQGVTVLDFRRSATIEVLEPFLLHGANPEEKVQCIADLLAARTQVLEYAMALSIERATEDDVAGLRSLTHLLLSAFETGDRHALSTGYHSWLERVVDSAHSLPARWIANPFLDLTRGLIERFPALWITDEGFAGYLEAAFDAIVRRDPERAGQVNRRYYDRVDELILDTVTMMVKAGVADFGPGREGASAGQTVDLATARRAEKARRDKENSEGESV
jgi:GntR family transcriptional repressor for pyruvate dehydrogenase complex